MTGLTELPASSLIPSKLNPRKAMDPAALEELAIDIAGRGVLQNLVVRPHPKRKDRYQVVCGARRLAAVKRLVKRGELNGQTTLPCRVIEIDDRGLVELALAENVQRADMTPLEEADGFAKLVKLGATPKELALRFGRPERFIRQRVALNNLIPEVKEALEAGKIGLETAHEFTRADPALQRKVVKDRGVDRWTLQAMLRDEAFPVDKAIFDRSEYSGAIVEDLFGESPPTYTDGRQARELQLAALEAKAQQLRDSTGLEVEVMPSQAWKPWQNPEVGAEDLWLDPSEPTEDDPVGVRENWEKALARQEKALARRGTRIVILHNDSLTVHWVWVVQRAAKSRAKATDKDDGAGGLSHALVADIQSERTRALRRAVAEMPRNEASRLFVCLILLAEITYYWHAPLSVHFSSPVPEDADRERWQEAVRKLEAMLPEGAESTQREELLDTLLGAPEVLIYQLLVSALLRRLVFEERSGLEPSGVGAYLAKLSGLEARHYQVTDADLKRFPRARLEELAAATDMVTGTVPPFDPPKMKKGALAAELASRKVVPEEYLSGLDVGVH